MIYIFYFIFDAYISQYYFLFDKMCNISKNVNVFYVDVEINMIGKKSRVTI